MIDGSDLWKKRGILCPVQPGGWRIAGGAEGGHSERVPSCAGGGPHGKTPLISLREVNILAAARGIDLPHSRREAFLPGILRTPGRGRAGGTYRGWRMMAGRAAGEGG